MGLATGMTLPVPVAVTEEMMYHQSIVYDYRMCCEWEDLYGG